MRLTQLRFMPDSDDYVEHGSDEDDFPTHKNTQGITKAVKKGVAKKGWEEEYKRSWDAVQEDESGSLAGTIAAMIEASKRRRLVKDSTPVQRGIIRHMVLIMDFGIAMAEKDLRPSRHELSINYACDFVTEYFEQNPISQLAIVGMHDGVATRVSDLGGNPQDHITALQSKRKMSCKGDASLQNALEMARAIL